MKKRILLIVLSFLFFMCGCNNIKSNTIEIQDNKDVKSDVVTGVVFYKAIGEVLNYEEYNKNTSFTVGAHHNYKHSFDNFIYEVNDKEIIKVNTYYKSYIKGEREYFYTDSEDKSYEYLKNNYDDYLYNENGTLKDIWEIMEDFEFEDFMYDENLKQYYFFNEGTYIEECILSFNDEKLIYLEYTYTDHNGTEIYKLSFYDFGKTVVDFPAEINDKINNLNK